MLSSRYKSIGVYRFTEATYSTPSSYGKVFDIKGIIQAPSNSNTFRNSKATSSIDGVLFCSIDDASKIKPKDKVQDINGARYIVSGSGSQPNGVTGLTPKKGQHCEFLLSFDDEA